MSADELGAHGAPIEKCSMQSNLFTALPKVTNALVRSTAVGASWISGELDSTAYPEMDQRSRKELSLGNS